MESQSPWRTLFARILARVLPRGIMRDKDFFPLWENRGYHVTPVHFYEPIPILQQLGPEIFGHVTEMQGVDLDDDAFIQLAESFARFKSEYIEIPLDDTGDPSRFYLRNGFIGPGDAEALYGMIRHFKPRRILEIGSGYTTLLMAQAVERNRRESPDQNFNLTCIDPYPKPFVIRGVRGMDELILSPLEKAGGELSQTLGDGDILFIDSSHVVRIGGDVNLLFLEILPRLKPGVLIHFHDIFLPEEYPEIWVRDLGRFWSEQYLLQAFLAFNSDFKVVWPGNYMRVKHPLVVEQAFPSFKRDLTWLGSFWIQRVR